MLAVLVHLSDVLQALERALRTGVMLLTAAQADTMWSISCGDAIDDAKQVTNRQVLAQPKKP